MQPMLLKLRNEYQIWVYRSRRYVHFFFFEFFHIFGQSLEGQTSIPMSLYACDMNVRHRYFKKIKNHFDLYLVGHTYGLLMICFKHLRKMKEWSNMVTVSYTC